MDVIGSLTPEAANDLGLDAGTKVVGGTPDVPAAAVGSGAVGDFEGHLYVGTSSWLTCHVPFKKTDLIHNMASLPSALPGRYFVGNEQETAGACMTWLRDNVFFRDDVLDPGAAPEDALQRFNALAAEAPAGSDKVIFTPWLYGEHTPVADPHLRAAFTNVSLRTTRAHMVRAVMEGVAYNTRWLMGGVESFIGRPFESIRFIGGGAKSDLWCQIFADVLDRPIDRVEDPLSANVRGAAFVAAVGLGKLQVEDIPALVPIEKRYTPSSEHRPIYDELFKAFSGDPEAHRSGPVSTGSTRSLVRHVLAEPGGGAVRSEQMDLKDLGQRAARAARASSAARIYRYAKRLPMVQGDRIEAEYAPIMDELRKSAKPYAGEVESSPCRCRRLGKTGPRVGARKKSGSLDASGRRSAGKTASCRGPCTTATPSTSRSSTRRTRSPPRPTPCTRTFGPASRSTKPRSYR